ncbi:MAG: hypothetical protein Q8R36_05560 [bacterium]|nr:hypothetical protein [bacterium]
MLYYPQILAGIFTCQKRIGMNPMRNQRRVTMAFSYIPAHLATVSHTAQEKRRQHAVASLLTIDGRDAMTKVSSGDGY